MSDQRGELASHDPLSQGTARTDSAEAAKTVTEVSVTETKATVKQVAAQESPVGALPPPETAVQLAFSAGWTMAVLYGNVAAPPAGNGQLRTLHELPTVHELKQGRRAQIELSRLDYLLRRLVALPGFAGSIVPAAVPRNAPADLKALNLAIRKLLATAWPEAVPVDEAANLEALNMAILKILVTAQPEVELAYHLGRSLRDTVNPPNAADDAGHANDCDPLASALERGRVARLQEWLATLSVHFPRHTTAIVATSLGRWSDFAAVTISTKTKTRLKKSRAAKASAKEASAKEPGAEVATGKELGAEEATAKDIRDHLLPQGDLWLMLLTGERTTNGLLSPEGYVAAGEAALRRSARIMRRILKHHTVVWIILAAALAFLLYLSTSYLAGSAKVWTSIATVGGTLGAAARTITNTAARLTAEAERPIFAMAEEDAMAWAITTLPEAKLTVRGVRKLRKAGIAPSSELGRV
jgi:hypothetical protein